MDPGGEIVDIDNSPQTIVVDNPHDVNCWSWFRQLFCCNQSDEPLKGPVPILKKSRKRTGPRKRADLQTKGTVKIRLSMAEEECLSPFTEGRHKFVKPPLAQRRKLLEIAQEVSKVMQAQDSVIKPGSKAVRDNIPFFKSWGAAKRKQKNTEVATKLDELDRRMQQIEIELQPNTGGPPPPPKKGSPPGKKYGSPPGRKYGSPKGAKKVVFGAPGKKSSPMRMSPRGKRSSPQPSSKPPVRLDDKTRRDYDALAQASFDFDPPVRPRSGSPRHLKQELSPRSRPKAEARRSPPSRGRREDDDSSSDEDDEGDLFLDGDDLDLDFGGLDDDDDEDSP